MRHASYARPRRGNAARLRARHSAGDAIPCRDRKEEGSHPEGLPDFLREFAAGGSGSRSLKVMCGKRVAPGVKFYLGAASALGAARSREARHLADAARRRGEPAASRMRTVHRPGRGIAGARRSRDLRHESQFQRPHGIARCPVLSRRVRKSSRHRLSRDTSRAGIYSADVEP
jgi:hypothetical protein